MYQQMLLVEERTSFGTFQTPKIDQKAKDENQNKGESRSWRSLRCLIPWMPLNPAAQRQK
jgi:hypothetical protein